MGLKEDLQINHAFIYRSIRQLAKAFFRKTIDLGSREILLPRFNGRYPVLTKRKRILFVIFISGPQILLNLAPQLR